MKIGIFTLIVISCCLIIGCAPKTVTPSPEEQVKASLEQVVSEIKIGESRASVEKKLGKPMSEERTANTISVSYMLGMENIMGQMNKQIASAQRTSMVEGLLSSALGSVGMLGGMGGSVAAGVGGQALAIGSQMAGTTEEFETPDIQNMRMINISYRKNKVYSVQTMNPGMMGGTLE